MKIDDFAEVFSAARLNITDGEDIEKLNRLIRKLSNDGVVVDLLGLLTEEPDAISFLARVSRNNQMAHSKLFPVIYRGFTNATPATDLMDVML